MKITWLFLSYEQSYITWQSHHAGSEVFLFGKYRLGVTALWSGKHVALCVPWEMYTGFLADFPCEQKQKSTKRARKLDSWPAWSRLTLRSVQVKRMMSDAGEAKVKGEMGPWGYTARVCILASVFIIGVTSSKLVELSLLYLPQLQMWIKIIVSIL